jgi:hypothetical protein
MRFACTGTDRAEEPVAIDDHTVDLATATRSSELPSAHTVKVSRRPRVAADASANISMVSPGPTARKCSIRTAVPTVVCPLSMNSAADGGGAAALLSAHGSSSAGRAPSASLSRVQMFMLITTPTISSLSSSSK